MRSLQKTFFTLLLATSLASSASALIEPTSTTSTPRRGSPDSLAAAKAKKPAASKVAPAATAPLRLAEPVPGGTLPPVPRPTPLPQENTHIQRYDAAIAPLRNLAISEGDAALLREAIANGANGKLAEAKAVRDRIGDASARKLVDWFIFRAGYGTATEIKAFLEANPAWPDRNLLAQRAEEALFNSSVASAR